MSLKISGEKEDLRELKQIAKQLKLKLYQEEDCMGYFAQKYSVRSTFRGKLLFDYSKIKS